MFSLIDDHVQDILITLASNPVTNVVSPTGTGKSTILPVRIFEAGNKVTVAVSNDNIAKSLNQYNPLITYLSQETLKNQLYQIIKTHSTLNSDILMIDECDSETMDLTLIMLLWRYLVEKGAKVPRLLLVSSFPIENDIFEIKHYIIETFQESPEIRYFPTDLNRLIYDTYNEVDGDILVFTSDFLNNMELPIYHQDEITKIYQDKNKKIVISDKLAETTISLNNISVIIDTLQNIKQELTLSGGKRIKKGYISKHEADLRASRGGKLVYRLISKENYSKLKERSLPGIYSEPLYQTMLTLINNGINPFDILTVFSHEELKRNYNMLIELGIINTIGVLTKLATFVQNVPLGLRNAVALYEWLQTGYPAYPGIVLLTMIDSFSSHENLFVYPNRNDESHSEYDLELLEHRKRHFNPFEGKSDVHTYSNIWNIMMDEIQDLNEKNMEEWCAMNSINFKKILEINTVVNNILQTLNITEVGTFDTENTVSLLFPILIDIYSDRKLTIVNKSDVLIKYQDPDGKYYKMDSLQSINSIERDVPDVVYGLITSTISSSYAPDFHLISCSLAE